MLCVDAPTASSCRVDIRVPYENDSTLYSEKYLYSALRKSQTPDMDSFALH